jgi:hypothetical protein
MPIKDQSIKLPRLGKVHLGKKVQSRGGVEHPEATGYFVVKADNSTAPAHAEAFKAEYPDKPTELDIMFAAEDVDDFASLFYRYYARGGLVCRGDGSRAVARIDQATGALVGKDTKPEDVVLRDVSCDENCPKRHADRCKPVLCLQFLLPKVVGLGAWQCDTSSFHSIRNIMSQVQLIKGLLGRISLVPLKLRLVPLTVQPLGLPQKTVHVLQLQVEASLSELRSQTLALPMPQVAMAALDDAEEPGDLEAEAFFEKQEEEPFPDADDLPEEPPHFPGSMPAASQFLASQGEKEVEPASEPERGDGEQPAAPRHFATMGEMLTAVLREFSIMAPEACQVLGVRSPLVYKGDLDEAYEKIAEHARSKHA